MPKLTRTTRSFRTANHRVCAASTVVFLGYSTTTLQSNSERDPDQVQVATPSRATQVRQRDLLRAGHWETVQARQRSM